MRPTNFGYPLSPYAAKKLEEIVEDRQDPTWDKETEKVVRATLDPRTERAIYRALHSPLVTRLGMPRWSAINARNQFDLWYLELREHANSGKRNDVAAKIARYTDWVDDFDPENQVWDMMDGPWRQEVMAAFLRENPHQDAKLFEQSVNFELFYRFAYTDQWQESLEFVSLA